jgi:hypothetical protein
MKLDAITPLVRQASKAYDDLSLVTSQQDWLKTISLGQIIKGKVLKVYDGNRYGIMMGGQERVVDSTIQFQAGQQFSAKVTDIQGEKVSLKLSERQLNQQSSATSIAHDHPESVLESLASQFNLRLTDIQKQRVEGIARTFRQEPFAIKVALYLAKLGLPITESLIREIIKSAQNTSRAITLETATSQAALPAHGDGNLALYQTIAAAFAGERLQEDADGQATQEDTHEASVGAGYAPALPFEQRDSGFDDGGEQSPLMKLLNIDTQGAIAHTFDVLSIIVNDRLLEFDIAFFDQAHSHDGVTSSKQLVFELETLLGKVGVVAKLVNNRLSLAFNAEQPALMDVLQQQKEAFAETLTKAGWVLEQAHYVAQADQTLAIGAVIDHVLAQGSMEKVL